LLGRIELGVLAAVRRHPIVFAIVVAWTAVPFVHLVVVALRIHGTLTGADGVDVFDQGAYLAWIRDAGTHFLASDLWLIDGSRHDYLNPLLTVSGLLWRIGLPIQLAYLFWRPIAVLVLFCGCAAYASRFLPRDGSSRAAALILAIFYSTPVAAIGFWATHLSGATGQDLIHATEDQYAADTLWGLDHTAIAIGLAPIFLLAVERALQTGPVRQRRRAVAGASGTGLLICWIYPWIAVTLAVIVGMLFILRAPRRRYLRLWPVVLAILAPYVYSVVLGRIDPAWHLFDLNASRGGFSSPWALAAEFVPLLALAFAGRRRPASDGEWMLVLWPLATFLVYLLLPEYHSHSLTGVILPLSILAVHGSTSIGRRCSAHRTVAVIAGWLAIGVFTIPAAEWHTVAASEYGLSNTARPRVLAVLDHGQTAALRYLDHDQHPRGRARPMDAVDGNTGIHRSNGRGRPL
jgi:hypothetical protein